MTSRRIALSVTTLFVLLAALARGDARATLEPGTSAASRCPLSICLQNVVARIEVGPEPWSVVPADGSIWVGNDLGVARVDPATNQVAATVPIGGVGDVAAGDGSVWVASYSTNSVGQVDLATNTVPHPVHVDGPSGLVLGEGAVWVVSPVQGTVTRIDPTTSAVVATIAIATPAPGLSGLFVPGAGSIAVGAGAVWATFENFGKVARIDPATNQVVATVKAGSYPSVAFAAGAIWVMRDDDQALRRIDPATNRVVATIPLHTLPWDLSVTEGALWVTGDGLIAKIDTSANAISQQILATEGTYAGLAVQGSDLWVARLASKSTTGAGAPDVYLLRSSLESPPPLPVQVIRGVPYTPNVPCGRYSPFGTCNLQTDVYSRPGAVRDPVIVLAHGGLCVRGCRAYLTQLASVLSLEGAVVFNVDVRQGTRATDTYHDLACAVRFARANALRYGGDPGRVTLVGHSMGSQRGPTVALAGNDFKGGCLAKGRGSPDAFVGMSGAPAPGTRSYIGRNKDLTFRYVAGSAETLNVDRMRAFVRDLRKAGYDATFTLVEGADHYSTYTPGSASPTLQLILNIARNP
jgi:acetyl esterase/lipase